VISKDVEKLIIKFLKKNCYGDFNYIMEYSSRLYLSVVEISDINARVNYTPKNELIIHCNFKSFNSFPGYQFLGRKLYTTLKPVLNGIDRVSIESACFSVAT
jgi:hypothetical protein